MIERFASLFSGYENVYGQYSTQSATTLESGKLDGKAWTKKGSPEWKKHIDGQIGLGIIPLRINNTVKFAAIDVDVYKLDHKRLLEKIEALGLPLVICRSKSGGAHLYVFFEEEISARIVIDILEDWASALGYGGAEIFPKQRERASPDDMGNWINLPYFGGDLTQRYAYDPRNHASQLNLKGFIELAESRLQTKNKFVSYKFGLVREVAKEHDLIAGGPPCLGTCVSNGGFPEGTRNDAMFDVCVFAKKKFGDEWIEHIGELNQLLCNPPLNEYELKQLIKSILKRDTYEMRCNGPFCNKRQCRQVQYGRGPMAGDLGIDVGNVTKIEGDIATWYIEVEGRRVKMMTKDLMAQSRFNERCVDSINIMTPTLPHPRWVDFIKLQILDRADIIQLPKEATWSGQFWFKFTQFCHAMGLKATTPEEVMIGKIYQIVDTDDVMFLPVSLFEFLAEARFKYESPEQIWAELLDNHVKQESVRISNSQVEVWRIKRPKQIRPEVTINANKEAF